MPNDPRASVDRFIQHLPNGDKAIRTGTGRIIKIIKAKPSPRGDTEQ